MRVILSGFDDEFRGSFAARLAEHPDMDVRIVLVDRQYATMAADPRFANTLLINYTEKLEYPSETAKLNHNANVSLSAEFIQKMYPCESAFLSISDRLTYFPVSVQLRKRVYYDLIRYWHGLLRDQEIECVLFHTTPHVGWDITLYWVARTLGLSTLMIANTILDDRVMLIDDYTAVTKVPESFLADLDYEDLLMHVEDDLRPGENVEGTNIIYIRDSNRTVVERMSLSGWAQQAFSRSGHVASRTLSLGAKATIHEGIGRLRRYFTKQYLNTVSLNSIHSLLLIRTLALLFNLRMRLLFRYYRRLTEPVCPDCQYVAVGLSSQPERSTSPEGGVFEDQLLMIDILAKSIPSDWKIYVKEHPLQFFPNRTPARHYRSKRYYKRLLSYDKVSLVDVNYDMSSLIRDSQCVATVTGSMGWEAMIIGKSCLGFGVTWYTPCNSCYLVTSTDECRQAISRMLTMRTDDVKKNVLRFLALYGKRFIRSVDLDQFARDSSIPYDNLVDNLVQATVSRLDQLGGCASSSNRLPSAEISNLSS